MLSPTGFRDLVSGRRRGIAPTLIRGVLRVAEAPYTLAVQYRNRRFDQAHSPVRRVGVPVICVGNLTLGGTGKTPMIKWLARWLRDRGMRPAIVSRGYGANNGQHNDEAMELAQSLPDVPHAQDRDRVAAAQRAIEEFNCDVVLLDDGFQHRRLARDLDIVLIDALEPFGFEHVFPRGTLREPLAGLQRANIVCLSRADTISAAERDRIRSRVAEVSPHAAWCELNHAPSRLVNAAGLTHPLEPLYGRRVAAFCGIGNPAGFRHSLTAIGCEIVAWREFPDHHSYTPADLAAIAESAHKAGAELIVCTQKDLVKLRVDRLSNLALLALIVEMRFLCGQEALERLVDLALDSRLSTLD
jgi:tetraacyldisaccharide 4'-kinase